MTKTLKQRLPKISRKKACHLLDGKEVLFTGDSLVRDTWTSMGLWLSDSGNMKTKENFAQCMANHWKMLKWSGVEDIIKANGILTSVSGVSTFKVCNSRVKLHYTGEKRFKDIPLVVNKIKTLGIDVWIVGAGIHEMVREGQSLDKIKNFAVWLSEQETPRRIIYMGTHRRIASRAPKPYRKYAYGEQGNEKIRLWNSIMAAHPTSSVLSVIDPYFITEGLKDNYSNTEDGMHFGYWVNLLKGQLLLQEIPLMFNNTSKKLNTSKL